MTRHTLGLGMFIVVSWQVSMNEAVAGETIQDFDREPGWAAHNLPADGNDFSFRNTNFAGGNAGEAGGWFSLSREASWYGDTAIGIFNGDDVISASGLMNIRSVEDGYNNNIFIGHLDRGNFSAGYPNGIGFAILEGNTERPFSFRVFFWVGHSSSRLFTIDGIDESRTWSYSFDPKEGDYGSLTIAISGMGENTATVLLSESQWNSIGELDTFGFLVAGTEGPETPGFFDRAELHIDNVSYAVANPVAPVGFLRGHTNADDALNIADAVCLLTYLFGREDDPCKESTAQCLDAADTNDDGSVNVADGVYVLQHIFLNGPVLPRPFEECGPDETEDELDCLKFQGCP